MTGWDDAAPYEPPAGGGKGKKAKPLANIVAERILEAQKLFTDRTRTVWRYTGTHWVEATEAELLQWAWTHSGGYEASRGDLRAEAVRALQAATFDPDHRWGRVEPWEVPCLSGIVDVRDGRVRKHHADHRLERVIPWDYDPKAAHGTLNKALGGWFPGKDEGELGQALQEFAGYILLNHCRFKKALLIFGKSNSGKSAIVQLLVTLVGREAMCQLSLDDMDDPRRRGVIVGKSINVMTELPGDAVIRQSGFNAIVSGEPLMIDDKFKLPFSYSPTAKHVVACEELPRVPDRGDGTFNRLLILPTRRVFEDDDADRDAELLPKLEAEGPGLLAWAIEGARRLLDHDGQFLQPAATVRALRSYRDEQNPVVAFLEECCVEEAGTATPLKHLLRQFNIWHQGSRRLTVKDFARLLRLHLRDKLGQEPVRKVCRKDTGNQAVRCLMNHRFVAQPARVEFVLPEADALAPTGEITAVAERDMAGRDDDR